VLKELSETLRAEFGAFAMYGHLSRSRADPELAALLETFRDEEREQIERLRGLFERLGRRAPARSMRREIVPWLLACASRCGFRELALRSCLWSEETVSRWYLQHAVRLAEAGLLDLVRTCEELSSTKQRHALALQAWVRR
jgi:rubrerythrin